MIELIDLSNWKKMREIKLELHREYGINISRDGREFRHAKEKWNKEFCEGNRPYYITHSNKNGYKAVTDIKEADEGLVDLISRSRKMENEVRGVIRGFQLLKNHKFNFDKGEII